MRLLRARSCASGSPCGPGLVPRASNLIGYAIRKPFNRSARLSTSGASHEPDLHPEQDVSVTIHIWGLR